MAIQVLPTSFFSQPEPQGGISSSVLRLMSEAGKAVSESVEKMGVEAEARLKAPVMSKMYSEGYQALATGNVGGLAALAKAGSMAAGNPLLSKMHDEASVMGIHVLDTFQKTELLKLQMQNRAEERTAENKQWESRFLTQANENRQTAGIRDEESDEKFDKAKFESAHSAWEKIKQEEDARFAKDSEAAAEAAKRGDVIPVAPKNVPPEPKLVLRAKKVRSGPIIVNADNALDVGDNVGNVSSTRTQTDLESLPLPSSSDPSNAARLGGNPPLPAAAPPASAPAGTIETSFASTAPSKTPEALRLDERHEVKDLDLGFATVRVPLLKDGTMPKVGTTVKVGNITRVYKEEESKRDKAAEQLLEGVSALQSEDKAAGMWISRQLLEGNQPKMVPMNKGKGEPDRFALSAVKKDGTEVSFGENLWVTKKTADAWGQAAKNFEVLKNMSGSGVQWIPNKHTELELKRQMTLESALAHYKDPEARKKVQELQEKLRTHAISREQFDQQVSVLDPEDEDRLDSGEFRLKKPAKSAKDTTAGTAEEVKAEILKLKDVLKSGQEKNSRAPASSGTQDLAAMMSGARSGTRKIDDDRHDELVKEISKLRKKYRSLGFDPDKI